MMLRRLGRKPIIAETTRGWVPGDCRYVHGHDSLRDTDLVWIWKWTGMRMSIPVLNRTGVVRTEWSKK